MSFILKLEFSCLDESEKFYPSKKIFGSTLFPSLFLWKTIWSSEDAMAGIPCSDLKNVPTTWSTRWPPALACRTRSSYSYSRSTEKPCPACHPCTTAGHTTGYKAKVPMTLRKIQSRSQGYVPYIPKSRTTLQQAQDSVSSHPLTDLTRSTMRTRTWEKRTPPHRFRTCPRLIWSP